MTNKPVRYHLLIPQGKNYTGRLRFVSPVDLDQNQFRCRIRKNWVREGAITQTGSLFLDPLIEVDLQTRVITIRLTAQMSATLIANCAYGDLPLTNTNQVNPQALQRLTEAQLPGGKPYCYELEWEDNAGFTQVLMFGGVLVPRETNRG